MELIEIIYNSAEGLIEAEVRPSQEKGQMQYNVEINGDHAFSFYYDQNEWQVIRSNDLLSRSEELVKTVINYIKWELNKCTM